MDWTLALERNQDILRRSVAWLFTWLALDVGGSVDELSLHQKRTAYFVLRPAESALRRLVYAAMFALAIVAPPMAKRAATSARSEKKKGVLKRERSFLFRLTDPPQNFDLEPDKPKYVAGPGPSITNLWCADSLAQRQALFVQQQAYEEKKRRLREAGISAKGLCRRLNAMMGALDDLEGQALRMAKLGARMKRRFEKTGTPHLRPIRRGRPPGFRQVPIDRRHEVDDALKECHQLANLAEIDFSPPDTS